MEEHSDEGSVDSGGSVCDSKLLLSGELPCCELLESSRMGSEESFEEGQVEESFEEGYGGEIMVEIVGSDVFVNGGQIGDLEGHAFSEDMDISDEYENGESTVGFVESKVNGCLNEEDNFVKSELLEAFVEEKVGTSEKEDIFPSTGNDVDLDCGIDANIGECTDCIVKMEAVVFEIHDEGDAIKSNGVNIKIEDTEASINYDGGVDVDCNDPESGTGEHACETDKLNYHPGYLSPPENEGQFRQSDMVWGAVGNHPWWPGQIFDQADASEKAVKCYKKDSCLVAYFGDQTFAWKDSSELKPFRPHFSQVEKQSNSEGFQSAVNSALEEVSRRVELGLGCSCIPKDAYIKIGTQVIENAGIRDESNRRCGVYHSTRAALFEPDKLLEYVSDLAPCASSRADRLDLVIARAQLSAFYRFKGYRLELLENDVCTGQASDETVASNKNGPTPIEGSHATKERSLTELMTFERKRKALDPLSDRSDKWENPFSAKFSTSVSHTPTPLLKIGACISRVASQLTGPVSLVKGSNDEMVIEPFSVNEMLSQLQLAAKDPKRRPNIQNSVHAFFLGFRNSIVLNRGDRKRKAEPDERFDFDDANDAYWKHRTIQNHPVGQLRIVHCYSGEQLRQEQENRMAIFQPVHLGAVTTGHKSHSRKRFSNYPITTTVPDDSVKRLKQESSPAELILNFAERKCVPSEISLNKIFRRFGSLMESETEVDHDSGRAKVIFKRGSDAEVALSSAEKFNIFGPVLVRYQIGYAPLISLKILPLEVPQYPQDETLVL